MFFPDLHEHVFERPHRHIARVAAPVSGSSFGCFGHLGVVGAAKGLAAVGLGSDLVAQVQVNVGQVKNLAARGALLFQ